MSSQTTAGGFAGDPAEAVNPAASGGCCGTAATANSSTCCGTTEAADAVGACCGSVASADAGASGAGCCG